LASGNGDSLILGDLWFLNSLNYFSQEIEEKEVLDGAIKQPTSSAITSFEDSDMEDQPPETFVNTATDGKIVVFSGLCRLCCMQGSSLFSNNAMAASMEECLPYAMGCFKGFQNLMSSIPSDCVDLRTVILSKNLHTLVSFTKSAKHSKTPPVLVAEAINCLGSCFWTEMGPIIVEDLDVSSLLAFFRETGENSGGAWTERAAAFQCISMLAEKCHENSYQQHRIGQTMIEASKEALKDRKYWRVR
jgi:hypothetical protein